MVRVDLLLHVNLRREGLPFVEVLAARLHRKSHDTFEQGLLRDGRCKKTVRRDRKLAQNFRKHWVTVLTFVLKPRNKISVVTLGLARATLIEIGREDRCPEVAADLRKRICFLRTRETLA